LSIYNLVGQKVTTLISDKQKAGFHQVTWNARNVPSGGYYAVLNAGKYQATMKLMLVR
jgi:flagellar hook assembly protein FlgD